MCNNISLCLSLALTLLGHAASAEVYTISTPPQAGVIVTTTLDTDLNRLSYSLDLSGLVYHYEQITFTPAPLPAFAAIPLEFDAVASPGLTEWNFHQITGTVDWQLELQYASRPPEVNAIDINYLAGTAVTGGFRGQAGDDNVVVTLTRPPEGFPPGQSDQITLWAYTPDVDSTPSVILVRPMRGAIVADSVLILAYSADPSTIRQITLLVKNLDSGAIQSLGSDNAAPYALRWNTLSVANGPYAIYARAEDVYGNFKTTTTRVTVANSAHLLAGEKRPAGNIR